MIQAYADGVLFYDSRVDTHRLLALRRKGVVNKAGTATLTMPPSHPNYGSFVSHRTLVTIHKDGRLLFRGRALQPEDDIYKRRTIVCEGERGFFRDAVLLPYLYQDSPANIFTDVVEKYNERVEEHKRFVVGEITVTDPNDYIRFESTKAEKVSATIDALQERCGGYITFTTNAAGYREVNWLAELNNRSGQTIEFGKNLTDFTRGEADTELATVLYPFGAKDEETGEHVNISSVNGGVLFLEDADAIALRGRIEQAVYWDDVTEPANLLRKGKAQLDSSRNIITRLQLSSVDLSNMDKNLDSFMEGDTIRVKSKPHEVDEDFLLTEKDEDLLDPSTGSISMGKEQATLVGLDAAGDRKSASELHQVANDLRADYTLNIAAAITETQQTLSSLIQQTQEAIELQVSEKYVEAGAFETYQSTVASQLQLLSDELTLRITETTEQILAVDGDLQNKFNTITKYFTFDINGLTIGQVDNPNKVVIDNDEISILVNGTVVQKFDANGRALIPELKVTTKLDLFGYLIDQDDEGRVNCEYIGEGV